MFFGKKSDEIDFSIGITTFESRFETYFKPLVNRIRSYDRKSEIVVAVNGEHNKPMDDNYRSRVLAFAAAHEKVYPIIFPVFRGLSKLWNTILIHAVSNYVLMLNDDVMIDRPDLMQVLNKKLARNRNRSFLINASWSHCLLNREEMEEIGYFDERLLGIGEEDGDMTWRYIRKYGKPLTNYSIKGIINYSEETMAEKPINIRCREGSKYSRFNRNFMFETKYRADENGIKGMFDRPMVLRDAGPEQYANERFYRERRNEL